MKRSKILTGILGMVTASTLCLTGCSGGFFSFFTYTYENGDKYTAGDREITEKITTINIDYVSGDVKLQGTDSDKVSITETSNKELSEEQKVHTWVDGSTLYVRYCKSSKNLSFFQIEKNLNITIPGSQDLDSMILHISSGNADFSGFTSKTVNAKSSSGNVTMNCSASDIVIKASSGKVALVEDGDAKSIDINSSSGTVNVDQKGSVDSVKIHSSSGSVTAALGKVGAFDVHVSSGHINVEAEEISDLKSDSSSGKNEYRLGKAPSTANIHSSSGGVKIYIPEDSNITVKPHLSSGEFNYELAFKKNGKDYVCGDGSSEMTIKVSSGNVDILKR
ncbi:MAG: DUF4097 family beta strand repeat protein [Clostridiales bacterium]|nr:DUF4097 family beta strand repeat protein [Clostridiales bacterium]